MRQDWCGLAVRGFEIVSLPHGAVAQLIERVVRNDEVVGLIPICSTISVSNRCWSSEPSLRTQRLGRVDQRSAPGGQVTGEQCRQQQQQRTDDIGKRIGAGNSKKLAL